MKAGPYPFFARQVLDNCQKYGSRPALIKASGDQPISYRELGRRVSGALQALRALGVKKGDRVLLAAARDFSFIYLYLAMHCAGVIVAPLDPRTPIERYEAIYDTLRPRLAIWPDAKMPESLDSSKFNSPSDKPVELEETDWDALSDIMFTSGTTGAPKGVKLNYGTIASAINNINSYIGNTAEDTELCPMPLSHSFGLARIRCILYAGGTLVLEEGISSPKRLFSAMEKHRVTGLSMVGPAWLMLKKLSGKRLGAFAGQLRYFELGSAAISPEEKSALATLLPGARVCMHYGLTEASRAAFLDFNADAEKLESVGRASPLCDIAIFSDDGQKLPAGEAGEVCVRGSMVTPGYLDGAHNQGAFHPGGYFRTGDLGRLDEKGHLYLNGRLKEIINVGGEKVSPAEVEKIIESLPEVEEAACVGMPDPVLGEVVAAFYVPAPGAVLDEADALSKIGERLESFKKPKVLKAIPELPRTVSGKIQRMALKELL